MKTSLLAICFLLSTIVSGAACRRRPSLLMVNPVYMAGKQPLQATWVVPGTVVDISIVEGRRTPAGAIGRNIEDGEPVSIVESPQGVSLELVRGALALELRATGFTVSELGAPAAYRVQIILQRFWVEEENTYLGEVRMQVRVFGGAGKMRGDALVSGTAKRWGRSLSVENYQETYDSALRDAIEKLFKDPRFQGAFRG
ncbi:MAG: hypothetical protein GY811_10525 [Myxococcales bacterium]|nr:hypothetical protein [Myxococcales bacterium]